MVHPRDTQPDTGRQPGDLGGDRAGAARTVPQKGKKMAKTIFDLKTDIMHM